MANFKKCTVHTTAFYRMNTTSCSVQFDCPADMYGKNFSIPSFNCPPKPLKFYVSQPSVILDGIFLTNSEQLGILFLKEDCKIYCTKLVYEQMLLKYEEYKEKVLYYEEVLDIYNNKDSSLNYETPNQKEFHPSTIVELLSIDEANLDRFCENVNFIQLNQIICLNGYKIQAIPAGTNIGWINYRVVFPNTQSLIYLTSYSEKQRFSVKAGKLDTDYLIINKFEHIKRDITDSLNDSVHEMYSIYNSHGVVSVNNSKTKKDISDGIIGFSKLISDMKNNHQITVWLPVDFTTTFIDYTFHILSIIDGFSIPIYIVSSIFDKLMLLLNIQTEWIDTSVVVNEEPFPLRKYKNLVVIEHINHRFKDRNKIIFCDKFENIPQMFSKQQIVELLDRENPVFDNRYYSKADSIQFKIKTENTRSEIMEIYRKLHECEDIGQDNRAIRYNESVLNRSQRMEIRNYATEFLIAPTRDINCVIDDLSNFYIQSENDFYNISINSSLNVIKNKLFLTGRLSITDFKSKNNIEMKFTEKESKLAQLMKTSTCVLVDGWIVFTDERIKCRITGNEQVEYVHF